MKPVDLKVKIEAEFQWLNPPENVIEQVLRERANALVASVAHKMNDGVRLMLLELVETMAHTE